MKVEHHHIEILLAFPENVAGHLTIHESAPYIVLLLFLNLKLHGTDPLK
jgi:hypothetical protein